MTEQTQPTDAELYFVWCEQEVFHPDPIVFARAVLAKWGTPAGAGEPFGYFHRLLNHEGKGNGVWLGAAERKVVEQAHVPGETSEEIVTLYTTPQPTQAQAGAVPLTDEQSHALLERMATEADQWAEGLSYEPTREQLSGWCVAFIQREIQAVHGIKGAGHG